VFTIYHRCILLALAHLIGPSKKVRFCQNSEIFFDKKDAPSNNILEVTKMPHREYKIINVKEEEVVVDNDLSLVSNIFDFQENTIADTNLLSSEELTKELEARGLETSGKKIEKLERLENYLQSNKKDIGPNKREVLMKRQKSQTLVKKPWLQKRGQFGSRGNIPQGWR
jgi:hypothetical protein